MNLRFLQASQNRLAHGYLHLYQVSLIIVINHSLIYYITSLFLISLIYLENPILASLDGLAHVILSLGVQRLLKQLFKCVHRIVHLLSKMQNK